MLDLKVIQQNDPIKRNAEECPTGDGPSAMDPPEAYDPPNLNAVPYEKLHPFLQGLMDDHEKFRKELDAFEEALTTIHEKGIQKEAHNTLRRFFHFFDHQIVDHSQREDRKLLPLLHERLLEKGEHSKGEGSTSVVDVMEDDHVKVLQMAAIAFNFFSLAIRLPDAKSRVMVLDAALEQGKSLVELLRLHFFREDNIVFTQIHKHLTSAELDQMQVAGQKR